MLYAGASKIPVIILLLMQKQQKYPRNTYLEEEVTDLFNDFPYVLNFDQRQAFPISNTPKGATTHVHL